VKHCCSSSPGDAWFRRHVRAMLPVSQTDDEVAVVRRIFHEFANEYHSLRSIAKRLNDDEIPYSNGVKWNVNGIHRALKNSTYAGDLVWGRTMCFLGGKAQAVPPEEWVTCKNAFEPLINPRLFEKAQAKFANRSRNNRRLATSSRSSGACLSNALQDPENLRAASVAWRNFPQKSNPQSRSKSSFLPQTIVVDKQAKNRPLTSPLLPSGKVNPLSREVDFPIPRGTMTRTGGSARRRCRRMGLGQDAHDDGRL